MAREEGIDYEPQRNAASSEGSPVSLIDLIFSFQVDLTMRDDQSHQAHALQWPPDQLVRAITFLCL